jgi:hypothetical protein
VFDVAMNGIKVKKLQDMIYFIKNLFYDAVKG